MQISSSDLDIETYGVADSELFKIKILFASGAKIKTQEQCWSFILPAGFLIRLVYDWVWHNLILFSLFSYLKNQVSLEMKTTIG